MGGTGPRIACALFALALVASACGDDDDDAASGPTAVGAATAATTATTAAAGATPDGATGAGSDNPKTGDAKDAADFLQRLATLYPAVEQHAAPIDQPKGSTTRGLTDTTITVGSVMAMTDAQGNEPFGGMCEAAMARIALQNSQGGVKTKDGKTRTIEFAGTKDDKGRACQDDKGDRDLNRQKLKDAVEGDDVFALLPLTSGGFFAGDYLTDQHVPYFGFGFQPDFCGPTKPFAFGTGGALTCDVLGDQSYVTLGSEQLYQAAAIDPKAQKVAIAGSADPSSTVGTKIVAASHEAVGAQVVTLDNSLPAAGSPLPTDFSPFVAKLLEKSPTVVLLVISFDQVEPVAKGLRDAGFPGVIEQFVFETDLLAYVAPNYSGVDGSYVAATAIGSPKGDGKGLSDIRAALDAAGFQTTPVNTNVLQGWASADMFIAMLENAAAPLTTESLVNTANAGWGYPGFGDAVCPTSWPVQHYVYVPCGHVNQLDLTGAHGATNAVGANGGKGGILTKVAIGYSDGYLIDKPK